VEFYPFLHFRILIWVVGVTCLVYKLFNYQVQYIKIYNVDV
jgi:hypothetical protein